MDNFNFGPFDASVSGGPFEDSSYVNTESEQMNRKEFSFPLLEIKDFINEFVVPNVGEIPSLKEHEINSLVGDGNIVVVQNDKDYLIRLDVTPTGVTKEYVDNQDASNLQSAKDYTDTGVQDAKDYTDSKATTMKKTLRAGETTITFEDSRIDGNTWFEVFTPTRDIDYVGDPVCTAGSVTYTFDAQEDDVEIGVLMIWMEG